MIPIIKHLQYNRNNLKIIREINEFGKKLEHLTDIQLKTVCSFLRDQYLKTKNLDILIVESFALTREVSKRTIGLKHYDVQLLSGLALHYGHVAEMKTGEGKTLVATLSACLNALTNKGVHIITTNEYLAKRDKESMNPIYNALGFTTGVVLEEMSISERKDNYNKDIVYISNSQLISDYLHDTRVLKKEEIILKPFNYCIIDEIDSILIDNIKTLIISAEPSILSEEVQKKIKTAERIVKVLKEGIHFIKHKTFNTTLLTPEGTDFVQKILRIDDIYDSSWIIYIKNALKANIDYIKDVDYIIEENTNKKKKVIIINESTGRQEKSKQWIKGLHQAIEAKENLEFSDLSKTKGIITYPHFYLQYQKISGMTGTGLTLERDFKEIYNLSVKKIPTKFVTKRKDLPDLIFPTKELKYNAIINLCKKISATGQPVLIGTKTIKDSNIIAEKLKKQNLKYQILNATIQNPKKEAEIIAQAGIRGSITIATNLAGRGTDINLGGDINFQVKKDIVKILTLVRSLKQKDKKSILSILKKEKFLNLSKEFLDLLLELFLNKRLKDLSQKKIKKLINILTIDYKKKKSNEIDNLKTLGGLFVIGAERNISYRIDEQLRGRCGRQGNPGTSQFFISLEDDLFLSLNKPDFEDFLKTKSLDFLMYRIIKKTLNIIQKNNEELAYKHSKFLLEYFHIIDKQREIFYLERTKILQNKNIKIFIFRYIELFVSIEIKRLKKEKLSDKEIIHHFEEMFEFKVLKQNIDICSLDDIETIMIQAIKDIYEKRRNTVLKIDYTKYEDFEQKIILNCIDHNWFNLIGKLEELKDIVGWSAYKDIDPLDLFKKEALELYNSQKESLIKMIILNLYLKILQIIYSE